MLVLQCKIFFWFLPIIDKDKSVTSESYPYTKKSLNKTILIQCLIYWYNVIESILKLDFNIKGEQKINLYINTQGNL